MSENIWSAVDRYICGRVVPADPALDAALKASAAAGLPEISVTANQGKLLQMLARLSGARRILEFGTLGGYSTIWLARALPADGRLVTLECEAHHAKVARANIANAGVQNLVDLRVGPALDLLPQIEAEGIGPFDFIFIDADKANMDRYFQWALKLSRPGSVIIADNVVRQGAVTDAASADVNVQGVRRFFDLAAKESRVTVTAIQTVGSKGHDGFAMAVVS
jgi:predicted O-methyltransferase YrrM